MGTRDDIGFIMATQTRWGCCNPAMVFNLMGDYCLIEIRAVTRMANNTAIGRGALSTICTASQNRKIINRMACGAVVLMDIDNEFIDASGIMTGSTTCRFCSISS